MRYAAFWHMFLTGEQLDELYARAREDMFIRRLVDVLDHQNPRTLAGVMSVIFEVMFALADAKKDSDARILAFTRQMIFPIFIAKNSTE